MLTQKELKAIKMNKDTTYNIIGDDFGVISTSTGTTGYMYNIFTAEHSGTYKVDFRHKGSGVDGVHGVSVGINVINSVSDGWSEYYIYTNTQYSKGSISFDMNSGDKLSLKGSGFSNSGCEVVDIKLYEQELGYERDIKRVMFRDKQIWPEVPTFTGLTFTAQEANSTVQLNRNGSPTAVNLEISTDGVTWTDYTIGSAITLANVGDKVYWRNKSEAAGFYTDSSNYYRFSMTGKIGASGDVTSLMNKNGTTTLGRACYFGMFRGCTSLTTPPELPATTLDEYCYANMFNGCVNLTTAPELLATTLAEHCYAGMFKDCTNLIAVPELSATTLVTGCYQRMFNGCTSIKLSETQTGEYQIPYRIPTTGTGTDDYYTLDYMFSGTGGTFTGTPTINTTYYLSNGMGPTLLSYEEIKAMVQTDATGVTNAINELNSKKAEYIEKFRTENHIYQYSGSTAYLLSDDGTQGGLLLSYRGYRISYDINMLTPMDEYFWGEINA